MIRIKLTGIKETQEKLNPERFKKAIIRSLDRAAKSGRQVALDSIRERYNIKESDLRKEIETDISPSKLQATITARGKHISLFKFSPKIIIETINRKSGALYSRLGRAKVGRKVAGVTVQIVKGARKRVRGGFVLKMRSGSLAIFKRTGKTRLPIKKMASIGSPEMFGSTKIVDKVISRVKESWRKNFLHEITQGWRHQK